MGLAPIIPLSVCIINILHKFTDYCSILAVGCLLYMTSDVRTKCDHSRVISILQVNILISLDCAFDCTLSLVIACDVNMNTQELLSMISDSVYIHY